MLTVIKDIKVPFTKTEILMSSRHCIKRLMPARNFMQLMPVVTALSITEVVEKRSEFLTDGNCQNRIGSTHMPSKSNF